MKRNDFEVEICANSIASVIEAEKGGADRVELCDNICEGGTTPSYGLISLAKEKCKIKVFVMIRPRSGDFVYNENEINIMLKDIKAAVNIGVDGFVIGCLNSSLAVDYDTCSRLIEAAKSLPITFHRAFDVTTDPFESLRVIESLGIDRILTSGQQNKAVDGIKLLTELQQYSPSFPKIMAGSGIDESNVEKIANLTGLKAFHVSLRTERKSISKTHNIQFNCSKDIPENIRKITSAERIKKFISILEEL